MKWCVIAGVLSWAGAARADVIYNEAVQGDFSDDRFAPTALTLAPGSNQLFGVMSGGDGSVFDRDYFSVTIPAGHVLSQIVLLYYLSPDRTAFIAVQPGLVFPDDPDAVIPSELLGYTHFGPADVGVDLLPLLGSHGRGFTPPLTAGEYSFWAQQSDDYTEYGLDFVVEAPAPGSGALALSGLVLCRRRRERLRGRSLFQG